MKTAFSWRNLQYPIILCPPMDGITDSAYRELVSEMGGSSALYCEFVNVKGVLYENPKTIFELGYTENQRPIIVQLFGSDPMDFYEASKVVVKMGFDAIDINMGCPAHKVATKGGGCALMGNTELAQEIVRMTVKGSNEAWSELGNTGEYEVTTKMRLGVCDTCTVYDHGMAMIDAGSKAVAIHGRTLKQMYTGEADWAPVKKFKENLILRFPDESVRPKVFGSGDAKSPYDAFVRLITTGADGVMIGRGSFGNPWVFKKEIVKKVYDYAHELGWPNTVADITEIPEPKLNQIQEKLQNYKPTFEEIKEMAIHHAELMVKDKGPKGIIQMRKHLGWYFNTFEGAKQLRADLVRVSSIEEMKSVLDAFTGLHV